MHGMIAYAAEAISILTFANSARSWPSIHGMQSAAGLDSNNVRLRLLLPLANPLDRPCGMLCDQWLRVGCRAFERRNVGWFADIAECDTHIAQKSAALYSLDGRVFEKRPELCVG